MRYLPLLSNSYSFFIIEILVHIVVEPWAICCGNFGIVDFVKLWHMVTFGASFYCVVILMSMWRYKDRGLCACGGIKWDLCACC